MYGTREYNGYKQELHERPTKRGQVRSWIYLVIGLTADGSQAMVKRWDGESDFCPIDSKGRITVRSVTGLRKIGKRFWRMI